MTSSARARPEGGIVSPRAGAVFTWNRGRVDEAPRA